MEIVILKGIFLKYLLLPILVIVLAIVLGFLRRKMPRIKPKVIIVYVLLASLCIALPGFLGFSGNTFNPYWYLIAMFFYVCIGIANVYCLGTYISETEEKFWFLEIFQGLVTLTSVLFGGYLFYLIYNWISPFEGYAFMAATSITIYIVPLAFQYCYVHYLEIPFEIHKTWQPPSEKELVDFAKIEFKTLLLLNIELTKRITDGQKKRIDAKAPSNGVTFGQWFHRATDDYNKKYPGSMIQLEDDQKQLYSWIFYTKKSIFHFRKFIDFDKTMIENGLTDRSLVICKRVVNNGLEDKVNTVNSNNASTPTNNNNNPNTNNDNTINNTTLIQ